MRFAAAFAADLPAGPIIVTRDGRATGPMLAAAVTSGLCAAGRVVLDGAVAATPTAGVLVRRFHAAGAIQISASHNPPEYNGMKLFDGDGRVLTAARGEKVVQRFRSGQTAWVDHERVGGVQSLDDTLADHASLLLATVNVGQIRQRQFKVLLDSNHGAGGLLGRRLLEALGCRLQLLGETPDGQFSHPAEPTAENLDGVRRHVTAGQADVGFCQDPDADRLAVIDETGRYIGEECTLALCLDHVLRERSGAVVANCATSRISEEVARKHEAPFFRSPVGEANVVDVMLAHNAVFGGEGNGGPIDPRVGYVRDSFVGMALILDAMAKRNIRASRLADELPRYEIHKAKAPLERGRILAALGALKSHFRDAQADHMDGLRLDWPGRWLLVRASNTEPIVRVMAEAKARAEAERLCREAIEVLSQS
jgi:phosphomannomutase